MVTIGTRVCVIRMAVILLRLSVFMFKMGGLFDNHSLTFQILRAHSLILLPMLLVQLKKRLWVIRMILQLRVV